MAKLLLAGDFNTNDALYCEGTYTAGTGFICSELVFHHSGPLGQDRKVLVNAATPAADKTVPDSCLQQIGADYKLKVPTIPNTLYEGTIKLSANAAATAGLFGLVEIGAGAAVESELKIKVATNATDCELSVVVYGALKLDLKPFYSDGFKCRFKWSFKDLTNGFTTPSFILDLYDEIVEDLSYTLIDIKQFFSDWTLPNFPRLQRALEFLANEIKGINLPNLPFKASYEKLLINFSDPMLSISVEGLELACNLYPRASIKGTLTLVFELRGGSLQLRNRTYKVISKNNTTIPGIKILKGENYFGIANDIEVANLELEDLSPYYSLLSTTKTKFDLFAVFEPASKFTKLTEVRADWHILVDGTPQGPQVSMLGATFEIQPAPPTPPATSYFMPISIIVGGQNRQLADTVVRIKAFKDTEFAIRTGMNMSRDFAMEGDTSTAVKESIPPASTENNPNPSNHFFELKAKVQQDFDFAILDRHAASASYPRLFRRLTGPLQDPPKNGTAPPPKVFAADDMISDSLFDHIGQYLVFSLGQPAPKYELPMLRSLPTAQIGNSLAIAKAVLKNTCGKFDLPPITHEPACKVATVSSGIELEVSLEITLGEKPLELQTVLTFDLERLTFAKTDSLQLMLAKDKESLEFLGFKANIYGSAADGGMYNYFDLKFETANYSIALAAGARIELEYEKLGPKPLVVDVTRFELGPSGLDVDGEVRLGSVLELNGIGTSFVLNPSKLSIKNSVPNTFSIGGSCPLPPALIDDAEAHVSIEFEFGGGEFKVKRGCAVLKKTEPFVCKSTRFKFCLSSIGIDFVGGEDSDPYHFYFTLNGSAEFSPQSTDEKDWALEALDLLPGIRLTLCNTPLTTDITALKNAKIEILTKFTEPKKFSFFSCFEMELRAIAFLPKCDFFNDDAALKICGQIKFADGGGDQIDPRPDVHEIYIGVPKKGSLIPRIKLSNLPLKLSLGSAVHVEGVVELDKEHDGFYGYGMIEIQGMPRFEATFAFSKIQLAKTKEWARAWFLYLQISKISYPIPLISSYMREVGFGFGYRYTLVSIKQADLQDDVKQLIRTLEKLSRTQSDLTRQDSWAIDDGGTLDSPPWTFVCRALFSQNASHQSPKPYKASDEKDISSLFLFDAVLAIRNDLTFLMAARGWINTNYNDYLTNPAIRSNPLLSGFILLSPPKKRFLAHVASNPGGKIGSHPGLPEFVTNAITSLTYSATLLIEPGLLHFELGWPNNIRWKQEMGPLKVQMRGGFLFRITGKELVTGISYQANGSISVKAEKDFGFVGVKLTAKADVEFATRYIIVLSWKKPLDESMLYGQISLSVNFELKVEIWIDLFIGKITKSLTINISFSAGLEVALQGINPGNWALAGRAKLSFRVMGRNVGLSVSFTINEDGLVTARKRVAKYFEMGLTSADDDRSSSLSTGSSRLQELGPVPSELTGADEEQVKEIAQGVAAFPSAEKATVAPTAVPATFKTPPYKMLTSTEDLKNAQGKPVRYFVLIPQVDFFVVPHNADLNQVSSNSRKDYRMRIACSKPFAKAMKLSQWDPKTENFVDRSFPSGQDSVTFDWSVDWTFKPLELGAPKEGVPKGPTPGDLAKYFSWGFDLEQDDSQEWIITGAPPSVSFTEEVEDERVYNNSLSSYEQAMGNTIGQVTSGLFKLDKRVRYDKELLKCFGIDKDAPEEKSDEEKRKQDELDKQWGQHQLRDQSILTAIDAFRASLMEGGILTDRPSTTDWPLPFKLGLVFRVEDDITLVEDDTDFEMTIVQREDPASPEAPALPVNNPATVSLHNKKETQFKGSTVRFERRREFSDDASISIVWDLGWDRNEPIEDYVSHYEIQRRRRDADEPLKQWNLRPVDPVYYIDESTRVLVRSRFSMVDNFANSSAVADAGGLYEYTITPVDLGGSRGTSLTRVIPRRPRLIPKAPVDCTLRLEYKVSPKVVSAENGKQNGSPQVIPDLVKPSKAMVKWTVPARESSEPYVETTYSLILRKEQVIPVGSYAADAESVGSETMNLPSGYSGVRNTDIEISIDKTQDGANSYKAELKPEKLEDAIGATWSEDSYQVFLKATNKDMTAYALSPVQLVLHFVTDQALPQALEEDEEDHAKKPQRCEHFPPMLEKLPANFRFPSVDAIDLIGEAAPAHVPMPGTEMSNLSVLPGTRKPHPDGVRAIQLTWNLSQTKQKLSPGLTSHFDVLELDVDSVPVDDFYNKESLAKHLQTAQQVKLCTSRSAAFIPSSIDVPVNWEAWYPTASSKFDSAGPVRNWNSWGDSSLTWNAEYDTALSKTKFRILLDELIDHVGELEDPEEPYDIVELPGKPTTFSDIEQFFQSANGELDPYGWDALRSLDLCACISIRKKNASLAGMLTGDEFLTALSNVLHKWNLNNELNCPKPFVELFFQPSTAMTIDAGSPKADELLAFAQLSYRPYVTQHFEYFNATVNAEKDKNPLDHISISHQEAATMEVAVLLGDGTILNPLLVSNGQAEWYFSCKGQTSVSIIVKVPISDVPPPTTIDLFYGVPAAQQAAISTADVKSLPSGLFSLDRGRLDTEFEKDQTKCPDFAQLLNIDSSTLTENDKKKFRSEYIDWSKRFFDHNSVIRLKTSPPEDKDKCWLAYAYPRTRSPMYVAPDLHGRVRSTLLVFEKWARNSRFYIQPHHRYELLWNSVRQHEMFAVPDKQKNIARDSIRQVEIQDIEKDDGFEKGGVDIVLDRKAPLKAPSIVRSGLVNLEVPKSDKSSKLWEVIVAEHPEQTYSDTNQTIARRLSYRGVAYSLLRRYIDEDWRNYLKSLNIETSPGEMVDTPRLPDGTVEILPPTGETDDENDDPLSVRNWPERAGAFQKAVQVIRWNCPPFFYEHKLLMIAQADGMVSPVTSLTQREFEYKSPAETPQATIHTVKSNKPGKPVIRVIEFIMASHEQCMYESTLKTWEERSSNSEPGKDPYIAFAKLADPDVQYHLGFMRNQEMQFDLELRKQFGKITVDGSDRYELIGFSYGTPSETASLVPDGPSEISRIGKSDSVLLTTKIEIKSLVDQTVFYTPVENIPDFPGLPTDLVGKTNAVSLQIIWFGKATPAQLASLTELATQYETVPGGKGDDAAAALRALQAELSTAKLKDDSVTEVQAKTFPDPGDRPPNNLTSNLLISSELLTLSRSITHEEGNTLYNALNTVANQQSLQYLYERMLTGDNPTPLIMVARRGNASASPARRIRALTLSEVR